MAFWALGAFDKVKNITEKLNIKDVSKKVINYVAVKNEAKEQQDDSMSLYRGPLKQETITPMEPKKILSKKQRMEIQLNEYKKLVKMQEEIILSHYKREKELLLDKQALLQKQNDSLIQQQETIKKEASKGILIDKIQSGEKSIEQVIEENIMIKQKILLTKNQ